MRRTCAIVCAVLLAACMGGRVLETHIVDDIAGITGTYLVILYGGRGAGDLSTVAILDREGDGYEITPHDPAFMFGTTEPREAQQAVEAAFAFVERYEVYRHERTRVARIQAPDGGIVGYEIRPYYQPFILGRTDPVTVSYVLGEGGKIRAAIRVQSIHDEQGE